MAGSLNGDNGGSDCSLQVDQESLISPALPRPLFFFRLYGFQCLVRVLQPFL